MEEDVRLQFEDSEKRYAALEKRFDDVKWYFGGAASFFTLWFAVLTVVSNSNLNSQKDDLRDFKTTLRADLGKIDLPPDIELVGLDRSALNGQRVSADLTTENDGSTRMHIAIVLRNKGDGTTGPMFVKLYSNDPIQLDDISTDEPKFKYEGLITPKNLEPPSFQGSYQLSTFMTFPCTVRTPPRRVRTQPRIKVFFGKGRVTQADVSLVLGASAK
jgi:hypothetical protein